MDLRSERLSSRLAQALLGCLLLLAGCGGKGQFMAPASPLSVMLVNSKVVVQQGAAAVAPIHIVAPTEAVQLRLDLLPVGVTYAYSAAENNPSGSVQFVASRTAAAGLYMPKVTVISEGREASMIFSLEVDAAAKP